MSTRDDHLRLLRQGAFPVAADIPDLTARERELLVGCGFWLEALVSGALTPLTDAQERFVAVARGRGPGQRTRAGMAEGTATGRPATVGPPRGPGRTPVARGRGCAPAAAWNAGPAGSHLWVCRQRVAAMGGIGPGHPQAGIAKPKRGHPGYSADKKADKAEIANKPFQQRRRHDGYSCYVVLPAGGAAELSRSRIEMSYDSTLRRI